MDLDYFGNKESKPSLMTDAGDWDSDHTVDPGGGLTAEKHQLVAAAHALALKLAPNSFKCFWGSVTLKVLTWRRTLTGHRGPSMIDFERLIILGSHVIYCFYWILIASYALMWSQMITSEARGLSLSNFKASNLTPSSLHLKLRMERVLGIPTGEVGRAQGGREPGNRGPWKVDLSSLH